MLESLRVPRLGNLGNLNVRKFRKSKPWKFEGLRDEVFKTREFVHCRSSTVRRFDENSKAQIFRDFRIRKFESSRAFKQIFKFKDSDIRRFETTKFWKFRMNLIIQRFRKLQKFENSKL